MILRFCAYGVPPACDVHNFSNRWLNGQTSLCPEWCFIMFYHVLSNVKPKRSMSACSKVALIGKHISLIHFFDFPGRRKPPPRHASTPVCGVAMLMLPFDELKVPSSERGRTHITFQYFSLFKTSLDSQTEHSAGRTELSGVFWLGDAHVMFPL